MTETKRKAGEIPAGERRHIPVDMLQSEILELDAAASRAGLSRAEWIRRGLLVLARGEL
jgi:hypothetical protein